MQTWQKLSCCVVVCLTITTAHAQTQCTNDGVLRSIAVIYAQSGQPLPCEVRYDKPAENQSMTLWRAKNQVGFCEAQAEKFIARLEALGWSCSATDASTSQQEE